MATGAVKWFASALTDLGNKVHSLGADVLRLGIVTATTVPAIGTAAPHWGGAGTTNFATTQVSTGGTQYTGPKALAAVTWTQVANVPTLRASDVAMTQDALGFTNAAYGIIYNDTDVNKRALAFVEISLAGTAMLTTGALTIDWGGAGTDILTITQS